MNKSKQKPKKIFDYIELSRYMENKYPEEFKREGYDSFWDHFLCEQTNGSVGYIRFDLDEYYLKKYSEEDLVCLNLVKEEFKEYIERDFLMLHIWW